MTKVIGVRFRTGSRVYYFDPLDWSFAAGEGVIVETARGLEFGTTSGEVTDVAENAVVQPLKPVVRKATEEDIRSRDEYASREGDAFRVCEEKILAHKLDMKLVDVEYTFNGSKVVFYFTADERVDFRELVKDLASHFRTRIELRQIGVRDEAKMLGGLGPCGRPICCKTFLDDFKPVSIKMAKEQNLSLSPTKISGLCGRLMCCLQYEQSTYEETKRSMPRTGREIQTPDGIGMAVENNAITEKTKVRLTLPDGTIELREYHYTCLCKPGEQPINPIVIEKTVVKEKPLPHSVAYVAPELPKSAEGEGQRRRRNPRPSRSNEEQRREPREVREPRPSREARDRSDAADPQATNEPHEQRSIHVKKPNRKPLHANAKKPGGTASPKGTAGLERRRESRMEQGKPVGTKPTGMKPGEARSAGDAKRRIHHRKRRPNGPKPGTEQGSDKKD